MIIKSIRQKNIFFFEWASKGMNIFHLYQGSKTFETVHESDKFDTIHVSNKSESSLSGTP